MKLNLIVIFTFFLTNSVLADMGTYDVVKLKINNEICFLKILFPVKVKMDYCVYNHKNEYISEFSNFIEENKEHIYKNFVSIDWKKVNNNDSVDYLIFTVKDRFHVKKFDRIVIQNIICDIAFVCEKIVNLTNNDQTWVDQNQLAFQYQIDRWYFYSIKDINEVAMDKSNQLKAKFELLVSKLAPEKGFDHFQTDEILDAYRKNKMIIIEHIEGC